MIYKTIIHSDKKRETYCSDVGFLQAEFVEHFSIPTSSPLHRLFPNPLCADCFDYIVFSALIWTLSTFKGTPWRHTRRSLQLQDVFKGADKLMAVFAFANLSFIRALKNFWSIACNCPDFLYSITSFPQPGSEEPVLHVIMLDARYDRDPTYSFHGAIIFQSRLFWRHHLSYQTVAHNNNTIVT